MVSEIILTVLFMIPLYGFLIWAYIDPEESLLFGKRWMYQEEPEFSPTIIRYTKFVSLITMIGLPILLISFLLNENIFALALIVFILAFIIGAFFIFTSDRES